MPRLYAMEAKEYLSGERRTRVFSEHSLRVSCGSSWVWLYAVCYIAIDLPHARTVLAVACLRVPPAARRGCGALHLHLWLW
jgi:hypothetical protein